MVVEKVLCNRCGEKVNGGGYSISLRSETGRSFEVTVNKKIDETGDSHACGRNCLMLILNDLVDRISGPAKVAA
ncbi:MAG: hypothetical protein KG012_04260 [Deltaproteobacteria bacterium]|nr:hypothetical protein [Deltaproteobacteria bacterium]